MDMEAGRHGGALKRILVLEVFELDSLNSFLAVLCIYPL